MENNLQVNQTTTALSITEKILNMVEAYSKVCGETLGERTRALATALVTQTNRAIVSNKDNITWNDVDLKGCGFPEQVKRWAKLGLTAEDKLWVDIRNNKSKAKKDIFIKPQYQTLEKLMVMYFTYHIVRFKTEVICIGDELEKEEDFKTGLTMLKGHKRNTNIDRNKYENIIGAYKIIYVAENPEKPLELTQLYVEIDRQRIERAYNASSSYDKTMWNNDTTKMVKKTVTWEAYNSELIRPFMRYPDDIVKDDLRVLNDSEEMDFTKETKFSNVDSVSEEVDKKVASEDIIDVVYEDEN